MAPPLSATRTRTNAPVAPLRQKAAVVETPATPTASSGEAWVAKNTPRPRVVAQAAGAKVAAPPKEPALQAPSNAPVDLSNTQARIALAQGASQLNGVSEAAGNKNHICGGAAVVSALIMNSTTPEAAKKNAEALKAALGAPGAKELLPPSLDRAALDQAFANFGKGTPSVNDVHVLQQAAYAVGRRYDPKADAGLNPGQLGGLVADLQARGATLGPETRFTVVTSPSNHWVAHAGPIEINSDKNVSVASRNLLPSGPAWSGDVSVRKDGTVEARTRFLKDRMAANGKGWTFELEPVDTRTTSKTFMTKGDHLKQLTTQRDAFLDDPAAEKQLR